jgi:hypothetical protein
MDGKGRALKTIQRGITDTIQSIFRLPLKTANKGIAADTGCVPTDIEWEYRRGWAQWRSNKYWYEGEYPWFASAVGDKGDMELEESESGLPPTWIQCKLEIVVGKDKDVGRKNHEVMIEELSTMGAKQWVYTDASKTTNHTAIGWA